MKLTTVNVSRSLSLVCVVVLLGLNLIRTKVVSEPIQAIGFWLCATGLLYGCAALVLWPTQLVAANTGNLGTRRPAVARGFGLFGLVIAGFFEALASAWSGHFHWPTFVVACTASGLCAVVALKQLGRTLKDGACEQPPTSSKDHSHYEESA